MRNLILQRLSLVVADVSSLVLAFFSAILITLVYHHDLTQGSWLGFLPFGISKALGLLVVVVFAYHGHYTKRRPFWAELRQIYGFILLFIIINLGVAFTMSKGSLKIMIVSTWVMFAIYLPLLRIIVKLTLSRLGIWQRGLYILGTSATAVEAYHLFVENRLMGYRFLSFVPETLPQHDINKLRQPVISSSELVSQLKHNHCCDIIVAWDYTELRNKLQFINYLHHNCLNLLILPPLSGLALFGANIEHFFGNELVVLRLNNNLAGFGARFTKRCFDLICVISGLILLLPIFAGLALAIKLSARGNVFYRHLRIGQHGKPFYCLKFQTMYPDSQERLDQLLAKNPDLKAEWEHNFKLKNDPRVTAIGRWLRKTSLDELPQLWNVLKGEMSLVGPRPIVQAEISRYKEGFYYYQLVVPGISGLWQVSGRSETDYRLRVRLDEWYVKNWSLWYDIVILIKTFGAVLKRSGAY